MSKCFYCEASAGEPMNISLSQGEWAAIMQKGCICKLEEMKQAIAEARSILELNEIILRALKEEQKSSSTKEPASSVLDRPTDEGF